MHPCMSKLKILKRWRLSHEDESGINMNQLKQIVEAVIMAAENPVNPDKLLQLFDEADRPSIKELEDIIEVIRQDCAGRGIELKEVANGYRFQTKVEFSPWVSRLWDERPPRYSRALLETLALIAYRQPITRAEIEEVRGVAVSSHIIKTLLEREWVKVVGNRDVPGKPALYATTKQFLDYFNLKSLENLPTLMQLRDIETIDRSLNIQLTIDGMGLPLAPEQKTKEPQEELVAAD